MYWCAADIGWVTGHSYIVYGPLCNGATSVMYEGTPDFPDKDRWWEIVERYGVTILYTAPTAIRTHMKWGPEYAQQHDLSSLRLLGSVGEPINPEAWIWYREHIGGDRCPVVDTWWQTETGMIMITPLPGITTTKPGSATKPFPGVDAAVFDEAGQRGRPGRRRLPRAEAAVAGDAARHLRRRRALRETYWSKYEDVYFAGDGARIDEDGDFWLLGRVDDVMNVSGHRISTIEVECALVDHHDVAEAAVAARNDAMTGQAIVAFVTLKGGARRLGREARGAAQPRRAEDRRDREAGEHRLHAGAAEDPQRQDHAPPAARRRREPAARRHDHARRPDRRRRAAVARLRGAVERGLALDLPIRGSCTVTPMKVENEELLPIGRFSLLTGLTAKALRHYDDLGLLRPTFVDPDSGYRWYALEQARVAEAIRRLRGLQLPLEEIAEVLAGGDDVLRERLEVHRARIEGQVVDSNRILAELDRLIHGEETLVPEDVLQVEIQDLPEITYACIRRRGATMEELPVVIPQLIGETAKWVFENGGPAGPPADICPMLDESTFDLRVGWPVATDAEPPAPIERYTVAAGKAAVHRHTGDYSELSSTWRRFYESLQAQGVEPKGEPRECYETSPRRSRIPPSTGRSSSGRSSRRRRRAAVQGRASNRLFQAELGATLRPC